VARKEKASKKKATKVLENIRLLRRKLRDPNDARLRLLKYKTPEDPVKEVEISGVLQKNVKENE
jgi:hypothetical protein